MWLAFVARYVIGFVASMAMLFCLVAIPIWALIWSLRYMRLNTSDIYFKRAKKEFFISLGLWFLMLITLFLTTVAFMWLRLR
jgi:hypothetical protein